MGVTRRAGAALALLVLLSPYPGTAQIGIRGYVVAGESGAPLREARVTAQRSGQTATTDHFGAFTVWVRHFPDTLLVAYIGRRSASVLLTRPPTTPLRVILEAGPIHLADVLVDVPAQTIDRTLTGLGHWQLSLAALRTQPAAIETDVFRALALVPAVSFTSPLSARPLIRGYAAAESSVRVDGFEVQNLYHLGRIFSAFPAEAASEVAVTTAPTSARIGGTLSGVVDITGRTGPGEEPHAGLNLSFASATGWAGGGTKLRGFGAARAAHVSIAGVASERPVPYDFQDVYASGLVLRNGRPRGRVSLLLSRDDLFDSDLGSSMDWNNLLLGGRWQLAASDRFSLELSAAGTRFAEDVIDLPARHSRIDLRNRFGRVHGGMDLMIQAPRSQLALGGAVGIRSIANRVVPRQGDEFAPTDVNRARPDWSAHAEATQTLHTTSIQVGARVDGSGGVVAWQPRLRVAQPLSDAVTLGLAAGRTARLFQMVSDPESEPDLAFYDFWLDAGHERVPIAHVDHATADLTVALGSLTGRASLFGSRGDGLAELRPSTEQQGSGTDPFRYGSARTRGVEMHVAWRTGGQRSGSLAATYVLSRSERDWDAKWVPWSQDRRHRLRVVGHLGIGKKLSVFGSFEGESGAPLTPVTSVLIRPGVDPDSGRLDRNPRSGEPIYIYGAEYSARGAGTARVDLGATYAFKGLWRSQMWVGLSILNVSFGPVAPLQPIDPTEALQQAGDGLRGRVAYERLFDLPAIPTLTLRVEF